VRFYQLAATDGGPLPDHDHLKVGAIIRVPRKNSRKPGAVFNTETGNWVIPIWVEVADPRKAAS
jgi:hypothetical protein